MKKACHVINKGLVVVTCGSYRRGRSTCGDVDILVTHPDGRSHKGVFGQLLRILKDEGTLSCIIIVYVQWNLSIIIVEYVYSDHSDHPPYSDNPIGYSIGERWSLYTGDNTWL